MSKRSDSPDRAVSKKILIPIDGSTNALRALNFAINLARTYESELIVLNVIPTPRILVTTSAFGAPASGIDSYYTQQESDAKHFLDEAKDAARANGVSNISCEVIRAANSVVEEIIDAASQNNVDLIVIGTRGLGGFKRLLQGSVSSGVVSHAHCNVLVVR